MARSRRDAAAVVSMATDGSANERRILVTLDLPEPCLPRYCAVGKDAEDTAKRSLERAFTNLDKLHEYSVLSTWVTHSYR